MKKINIILVLVAMLSLLGLGAVVLLFGETKEQPEHTGSSLEEYQENYIGNLDGNKEIVVEVAEQFAMAEGDEIYTRRFQQSVRAKIDELIDGNAYTEDKPLVIYNPFLTNTQSLYVYFETEEPYAVSYSVHTPEAEYEDFGGYVIPSSPETSKIHEFQVIGLIPGETNMITIRMMDVDGAVRIRRFYYYNPNGVAASTIELEAKQGMKEVQNEDKTFTTVPASQESVAEGMFVVCPAENEVTPYLRIYDNDGIQRGEIPLVSYGTTNLLVYEDFMFYRVSEDKLVGVNRLGQAVKIFTSEDYTFGADYCFDKNNDILMLASDKNQSSIDDCVILLDRETLAVTELVDLGDLLPELRSACKKENGVRDWISLNSITLVEGNRILLSAQKTNTIIKIRRLYNEPKIAFLAGAVEPFEKTSYAELFLREDNKFEMHHGLNQVLYEPYDLIRESRHYICVLNNNEDYEYEKKQEHFSYYYRYLVDEAEGGIRLIDSVVLPEVGDNGSMQWYNGHLLVASDVAPEFYEYDDKFQLITRYIYEEPVVKKTEEQLEYEEDNPPADSTVAFLRVLKQDFTGYYFNENPVIIQPMESETEENLSENE